MLSLNWTEATSCAESVGRRSSSMGLQDGNSVLLLLLIICILFFACICSPTSSQLMSPPPNEQAACAKVDCGMGTCRETPGVALNYTCDCYSGWTKPQLLGIFTVWPSCIIPNCSISYQPCGGEPPLPPPPPPSPFPPSINVSLPCLLPLCGDGDCVPNGVGYKCHCPPGSANLLGLPTFPCFRNCNLGADCHDVGFGPPATAAPPPPMKSSASPGNGNSSTPSPPASPRNGLADAPSCSRSHGALSWMLLAVIVVSWI